MMKMTTIPIGEMIDTWIAVLPEKTRKSAKSDINTALRALSNDKVSNDDVLERARNNPTELFDDLDTYLRDYPMFAGPTRTKIKSVFRRFLRFHGIETIIPTPS